MSSAVRVEGLGKRFQIAQRRGRRGSAEGEFWALRGVNFEIERGEAVGIVGRNGSGKSTLLKILSRITPPSEGRAEIRGRVSSLLEVGTGFHPELTGRENVFMNGAILGMRRSEIRARFDEIVEFAGVEKFLDTPAKRYSSGMRMRLAFAVAAHLEPDILIVDEVLAVGDARFQQKCLERMLEVAGSGRTVLFVSHNLAAVEALCPRALLLDEGRVVDDGASGAVVRAYLSEWLEQSGSSYRCDESVRARAWIEEASLRDAEGNEAAHFAMTDPMTIRVTLRVTESSQYALEAQVKELNGNPVFHFASGDAGFEIPGKPGVSEIEMQLPPLHLYPGDYRVRLLLCDLLGGTVRQFERLSFSMAPDGRRVSRELSRQAGLIFAEARWRMRRRPDGSQP